MKRKPDDLSPEDQAQTRALLMRAAQTAFTHKNIEDFLEGLLTPSEQIMLGRRIWIARMLIDNKRYDEIGARLHVGPGTIRHVELWLLKLLPDYGKHIKVQRRKMTEQRRREVARQNPFGLTALKKKYPLHFLLFPWPKV
jgi:Trp operon repressor